MKYTGNKNLILNEWHVADDSQERPLGNLTQNSKSVVVFWKKNDRAVSCNTIVVLIEIKKTKWCE
jgi:hypothetical protein